MAVDRTISVLIVDPDDEFVEDTKSLLDGHKSYTARNINDAQRRLVEEGIDLAIVGPSYAHEAGITEASMLFDVQPRLPVLLIAEEADTRVQRCAPASRMCSICRSRRRNSQKLPTWWKI